MLGQLDKVLREASTLDGVLEFREEHFWTLSFGSLVICPLFCLFVNLGKTFMLRFLVGLEKCDRGMKLLFKPSYRLPVACPALPFSHIIFQHFRPLVSSKKCFLSC